MKRKILTASFLFLAILAIGFFAAPGKVFAAYNTPEQATSLKSFWDQKIGGEQNSSRASRGDIAGLRAAGGDALKWTADTNAYNNTPSSIYKENTNAYSNYLLNNSFDNAAIAYDNLRAAGENYGKYGTKYGTGFKDAYDQANTAYDKAASNYLDNLDRWHQIHDNNLPSDQASKIANDMANAGKNSIDQVNNARDALNKAGEQVCGTNVWCWIQKAFEYVIRRIAEVILTISAAILGLAGLTLDASINYSIVNAKQFLSGITAIDVAWRMFRDLANVSFIFILLYAAIGTILDLSRVDAKRIVKNVIIIAILINFSMFFTEVLVDASNILTTAAYNQATSVKVTNSQGKEVNYGATPVLDNQGNPVKDAQGKVKTYTSLSVAFMNQLGLATIYPSGQASGDVWQMGQLDQNGGFSIMESLKAAVLGGALILVTAFVFFTAAILLLIRFVVILILIITSAAAFAAYAVPSMEKWWHMWWDKLIDQILFAPAYMLMVWVAMQVVGNIRTTLTQAGQATGQTAAGFDSMGTFAGLFKNGSFVGLMVNFAVMIALMFACIRIAKNFSATGTELATKLASKASFGLASVITRNAARAGKNAAYYVPATAEATVRGSANLAVTGAKGIGRAVSATVDKFRAPVPHRPPRPAGVTPSAPGHLEFPTIATTQGIPPGTSGGSAPIPAGGIAGGITSSTTIPVPPGNIFARVRATSGKTPPPTATIPTPTTPTITSAGTGGGATATGAGITTTSPAGARPTTAPATPVTASGLGIKDRWKKNTSWTAATAKGLKDIKKGIFEGSGYVKKAWDWTAKGSEKYDLRNFGWGVGGFTLGKFVEKEMGIPLGNPKSIGKPAAKEREESAKAKRREQVEKIAAGVSPALSKQIDHTVDIPKQVDGIKQILDDTENDVLDEIDPKVFVRNPVAAQNLSRKQLHRLWDKFSESERKLIRKTIISGYVPPKAPSGTPAILGRPDTINYMGTKVAESMWGKIA